MHLNIDYHFHPNLSKNNKKALTKCHKIWEKLKQQNIRAILATEHAYKNPKRAYELMLKTKPDGFFCFPGVECVTKEGIDIIVFSNNDSIYDFSELKPFKLSYFDLINFVQAKKLHAFVTHPYTLGLTSVINKLSFAAYKKALDILNAVEISNGAFDNLYFIIKKFPFNLIFRKKAVDISKTRNLPKSDYPQKIKFFAVGSDAHHCEEIGNCYRVDLQEGLTENSVFEKIINNKGHGEVVICKKKFDFPLLIKSAFTALTEFSIKMVLKTKLNG